MNRTTTLLTVLLLAIAPGRLLAAPFVPADDEAILETLPARYDPELTKLAGLRGTTLRNPADLAAALLLARAYIDAARRNGDPRFLGFAQATLQRWGGGAETPVDVRVLRATVLQSLHQFDAALGELDRVMQQQPGHAQALLTRATILQVRGRYPEAQRDCAALWRNAGEVTAELCLAGVASVTGRLDIAKQLAERALAAAPADDRTLRLWGATLLAETAARQGRADEAEAAFRAAMSVDAGDRYLRATYCDFLLDRGQPARVIELTDGLTRDDNLLLRRALALQGLVSGSDSPATTVGSRTAWQRELRESVDLLRERHAAARARGEGTHLREEARFTLALLRDAAAALQLARENWAIQKEPADARILQEAATAAGDARVRS